MIKESAAQTMDKKSGKTTLFLQAAKAVKQPKRLAGLLVLTEAGKSAGYIVDLPIGD